LRPMLALYIGGMGAKGKNFYADLAARYGYAAEAAEIQDLYLSGNKGEAMMAVPAGLIDDIALVGPRERVQERLSLWRNSPVTTLNMMVYDVETLRTMVELVEVL
ncbi:MAG TPA: LLM class flavin-dependent oxidoreductase, partial [Anaerolineae bacterium]|nr:LLM class flavin-dependent oxidoreductase [Anaerolineae bacterium]